MILPKLKHRSRIQSTRMVKFGGLNHTKNASEGDIYNMLNMSSKDYPLLSTRDKRERITTEKNVKAVGDRWIIKGTDFIYDGEIKNEFMPLSDTPKTVVEMGAYVLIFPDKYYYNTEEDKPFAEGITSLKISEKNSDTVFKVKEELSEATRTLLQNIPVWINGEKKVMSASTGTSIVYIYGGAKVGDTIYPSKGFGTLQVDLGEGVAAKNNSSSVDDIEKEYFKKKDGTGYYALVEGLREGDGIVITDGKTEQTVVVKKIGEEKIFLGRGALQWESENCTASRKIPDFEFMCVCENRLWGVHDGTIYASKLGDPKNFYVYQVLSTDAWAVDYLTKKFTGAITYNGKPTFWTEDCVITIYGNTPATYQAQVTDLNGVLQGAGSSMAVASGYLFYLSPQGICVYGGRYPTDIHVPIGLKILKGYGFTDGTKYYIDTEDKLYVYDQSVHLWHIEDSLGVCNYNVKDGTLSVVTNKGDLYGFTGKGDEEIESFVEFGDFYVNTGDKKAMSKLNIRIEAEEGAEIKIRVKYDSENGWETAKELTAAKKRSFYIPFVPRRCDHYRLKIIGTGGYSVYSMSRENYIGSAN